MIISGNEESDGHDAEEDRKSKMNTCQIPVLVFCAVLFVYMFHRIVNETNSEENNQVEVKLKTIEQPKEVAINYSKTNIDDEEILLDPYPNEPFPRVAWLMSFPNSGTTYTIHMVQEATQTTSASNYGKECKTDENKRNVPVRAEFLYGPYFKDMSLALPSKYVLTKTHCGGRCVRCGPDKYLETRRMFRRACLQSSTLDDDRVKQKNFYDSKIVHRAVHLVRDPFDNAVARFHYEEKYFDESMTEMYSHSEEGFRNWCRDTLDNNKNYKKAEEDVLSRRFFDDELKRFKERIPCFGEFYRYIQWHNMAFLTTHDMKLPTLVVHYSSYETMFNETLNKILNFLELERTAEPSEFIGGKSYREYFTEDQVDAVREMATELASTETWEIIRQYFE